MLFCNPTHETETGAANTTNSKPPGRIIMMGQSETLSSRETMFITLFFGGAQGCSAFHQPQQCESK